MGDVSVLKEKIRLKNKKIMSINLDKSKINIIDLLKISTSKINQFDLINFLGDSALQRGANEISIFNIDENSDITILDNGDIPSDFILDKGLEFHDLEKYAPYIYHTSAISDKISISYYDKHEINKVISYDLNKCSGDLIKSNISEIKDPFLIKEINNNRKFFALTFKLNDSFNFYEFLKKINHNFTYRYHKLLHDKKLKIISLPERVNLRPFDPLFYNYKGVKYGKTIEFRGNYKFDIRYIIIPKNITKEFISTSCPSGNLDSCSGLFVYNKKNILINKPSFYDFERRLNLPQYLKEKNIKYIKIEINSYDNKINSDKDINILFENKFLRKTIISMFENAAKKVPIEINIVKPNPEDEFKRIILSRYKHLVKENKSKDDCFEELTFIFKTPDQKKLIEELVYGR